ncbi:zinc finger BED domain-containing protein 1-like [Tetranychus urticae]|uniref:zinc finger BED domain-containing protein 1-like n=1 Tax=Tetranychus urticae TaxID=32264 RepID=UPI000D64DDD9|nr:zinc finger BED domain-containing protein 1-like [Tetranychus urticae]
MSRSPYWQYFSGFGNEVAKCKICDVSVKTCGNTTNIARHLREHHPTIFSDLKNGNKCSDPKQPKISQSLDAIKSLNGGDLKKTCDTKIVWWLVKNYLPFNTVESQYFKDFLLCLNKNYKPPGRKTIMSLIQELGVNKKELLRQHFKTIKWFCLTGDSWKDILNQKSYLGLTIHFLDNYQPTSICLNADEFTGSMTGDAIFYKLSSILDDWEIPVEKIVGMTTDGGANFINVASRFGHNIHCVAHRLNLVATNAIDSFEELVSLFNSVRKIVTNLKQSCKLMSDLRDERVSSGKEDLKPIQDVITRWNSSYLMIERYLELRIEISYVLLKHSKRDDDLTDSQVNILQEIVTLLKPLYEMTLDISGEKYVTISRVIPLVVSAITYISTIRVETSIAKRFKLKVIANLNARFENIENKKVFGLATLLDPRFKKLAFQSETSALANQRAINAMLSEIPTTQIYRLEDSTESSNSSGIWSIYDKKVRNVNVSDGMDSGLLHYLELPVLDRSEDPLEFWRKNKENWPQLHNLAIKYLTLQATSVPSERLFSKTGDIITQKRNRIKPKNVNLLCFLESLPNCYI